MAYLPSAEVETVKNAVCLIVAKKISLSLVLTTRQDIIFITRIYEHDPNGLSTGQLELSINPLASNPGGLHTISTYVLSRTLGVDMKTLDDKANNDEWFIHVDWKYEIVYPKFTTRHRVISGSSLSIHFAGGTAWAENIASNLAFQTSHQYMPVPDYLRCPTWDVGPESQEPYFDAGSTDSGMSPELPSWRPLLGFPETPRSMSPSSGDDEFSVCSDPTTVGSTIWEHTTPRFFTPPPSRQNSSIVHSINNYWMDQQIQLQFRDEAFLRQKQDAEDLFARTGDVSGLIAVMEAANGFSVS